MLFSFWVFGEIFPRDLCIVGLLLMPCAGMGCFPCYLSLSCRDAVIQNTLYFDKCSIHTCLKNYISCCHWVENNINVNKVSWLIALLKSPVFLLTLSILRLREEYCVASLYWATYKKIENLSTRKKEELCGSLKVNLLAWQVTTLGEGDRMWSLVWISLSLDAVKEEAVSV